MFYLHQSQYFQIFQFMSVLNHFVICRWLYFGICKLGGRCLIGFSCTRLGSVPPTKLAYSITEIQEKNKKNINEYIDEWMWIAQIKLLLYVFMYIHVYWCVIIFGSPWSVKCQTQFSRSIWTGGLPPPVNELCTREHEARHSKTLADFAVPDNTAPPPPKPGLVWLLALSAWFWWMPDELKRARRVHTAAWPPHPCPHLVYLGTFWIWWRKK